MESNKRIYFLDLFCYGAWEVKSAGACKKPKSYFMNKIFTIKGRYAAQAKNFASKYKRIFTFLKSSQFFFGN